ncbi:MAG TPA: segregation/condensation protein A [Candidatus Sulfotelmatobacter sp.]|nr:segregation/condensation protein A [Candidatus Sulfotelmatobacter sp.]
MTATEVAYQVELDVFAGPFDLLLKAIDDGEIDVYRVSIAQVTAAYLEYWRRQGPPLVLASDFLVMAAYLVEVKSKALLPAREEAVLPAEDVAEVEASLLDHIQEYQVFKQIALGLRERKETFARIYSRHEGEKEEKEIALVDVSLRDLVLAFQKVYQEAANREKIVAIKAEEITLEARIAEIKRLLVGRQDGLPFEELFIRRSRLEVVVTFLAILELAKQHCLAIKQGRHFGSIVIFGAGELAPHPVAVQEGAETDGIS